MQINLTSLGIIILAIGLAGVACWYFWEKARKTKTTTPITPATPTPAPVADEAEVISVKELFSVEAIPNTEKVKILAKKGEDLEPVAIFDIATHELKEIKKQDDGQVLHVVVPDGGAITVKGVGEITKGSNGFPTFKATKAMRPTSYTF